MDSSFSGFLRKNLRLIAKPIALTILFFAFIVWAYFAFSPTILSRTLWVAEESARLGSLESFLSALFQGNLGYSLVSFTPVWNMLLETLWRTLLLIVLSTLIFIATGMILALISLKLELRSRKPMTLAHSQKGFFFGLTEITGIILILLFSVTLRWFPPFGMHTIGVDYTNIFAAIADYLRHLVLPGFTFAIIFMVRGFLVVWSNGSFLASKKTFKRLLLRFTKPDFAGIISTVVLVEWTFGLFGVGSLLLRSMQVRDFTVVVGAFVVLLVIAVILEYVSVLFEFVQQRLGLGEDFDGEIGVKSETNQFSSQSNKHAPPKHSIRQMFRRKSLVIGLVMVVFFIVMAAYFSPITPVDPLYHPYGPSAAQILFGLRVQLVDTVPIATIAALAGLSLGFLAAYFQSWVDYVVMAFAYATLAMPVLPFLITFSLVYWFSGASWFLVVLWPLCALATMASRNLYSLRPNSQQLSSSGLQDRFLYFFRGFIGNLCLVMVSATLLKFVSVFPLVSFHGPFRSGWRYADWTDIISRAMVGGDPARMLGVLLVLLACLALFIAGFLLVGVGLDERR